MYFRIDSIEYDKTSVTVDLSGVMAIKPCVIVSLYDENDSLIGIRFEDNVSENEVKFNIDIKDAAKIKVFVWENLYNIKPLSYAKEKDIN